MFVETVVVAIRQHSHVRVIRSLRPLFFIDTHLMRGVRRYIWCTVPCQIMMSFCLILRVLRQIFQSLKQIADVILLLLFVIVFFALIGKL